MGVEKEGSKSGAGHVGGFFQLFDWTAKSRKKLFSSKSDLPESSKQGKKSYGNLPMTRQHLVDEDETGVAPSVKGSSDYSCASSVTDEEGFGTKAPSVVARLMGLDSLPTSNSLEPYSTPFFDTQSLQDAPYHRRNIDCYHDDQLRYSGNLLKNMEGPTRNPLEAKPQKLRPIERFQTETLPPRSAKSIPITHHKLLSPIKNPSFVPTKNAAHIMEAAAKIMEPGPQATAKAKMPLVGCSSVPLKVQALKEKVEASRKVPLVGSASETLKGRDLKDKVEAGYKIPRPSEVSRKPVESNAAKYLRGQSLNKSWNGSVDLSFGASSDTEETRGKSISLAIQAKVNVQKRGQNLSRNRSLVGQKEQSEVSSNQSFRSQPNVQKNLHKKPSTYNASGALRQNNQKQNCLVDKEKLPSKPLVSNSQGRKVLSGDSSSGRHRSSIRSSGNSKIGSRKLGSEAMDSDKEVSYSNARNYPRKKRSIDGNFQYNKNQAVGDMLSEKNQKPVQSNPITDRNYSWAEDSRKKGMDVVSFTFTAPLTRSLPGTEISAQVAQKNTSLCMDHGGKRLLLDKDSMKLSSLGYNVIGGDALSMLLEQKLRELSYGTKSSSHDSMKEGSASTASTFDLKPKFNAVSSMQRLNDQRNQQLVTEKLGGRYEADFSFADSPAFRLKQNFQGVNKTDEYSSSHGEAGLLLSGRHPSPVSVLEPSFSNESYDSSISTDSNSTEASRLCSSVQAQEVHVFSSSKKFHSVEADTELLDSASSTSTGTVARNHAATVYMPEPLRSNEWELEYIKGTLCNVELMFRDFSLGRAREIINPHLFNLLESRRGQLEGDGGESRLRRKELFDCTSECLDLRCRRYVGGGYRSWVKGVAMVKRKGTLAEEVYKEFSCWRGLWDCMVDELVDKDMSNPYGRWLDFETDAFELGVEVEDQIFNSLVDEVVADILEL
ncbi:PREDICTED: DUF4378 [Prunus dulcis]|uniref:PREDICTED: DUF4378 n=1 Tax=Prunus dulcis TaxID=3755 RepID=A0A5E4FG93_PRUDU|nr:uncharacterized protein LOC117637086 [Prunus dulcis]XP_034227761.1 uncharacterized protein LOC117637086 [Prunus dulcis]XP_034227771.1 uncharacterized protein LOC117637086 [Prunus dulcis]VVA24638.1 PREDICTED: DUF4378 [Prunus dulcis]